MNQKTINLSQTVHVATEPDPHLGWLCFIQVNWLGFYFSLLPAMLTVQAD